MEDEHFFIYLDRCIKNDPEIMKKIFHQMKLPIAKTTVAWDEHYVCGKCKQVEE